jgi:hypothetical protein
VNPTLLIHAIVRQTMVLIAVLATAAGQRTPLANIADQVFAALVRELSEQGVGHKVIADMLGMALRTYHKRVSRLSASDTDPGRSLWEAVLTHVRGAGPLLRAEVLARFDRDNELVVRSVLRDLVDSGLLYQTGRSDATSYRAADATEMAADPATTTDPLVLVAIHQYGPLTLAELRAVVPLDDSVLEAALRRLQAQGATVRERSGERDVFRCEECVIPLGASVGWEASVFDHYQAMVTALVTKLRVGARRSSLADKIGGSTFTFDLWQGHPLAEKVLAQLQAMREQGMALRKEVEAYQRDHAKPDDEPWLRVTTYMGQTVKEDEEDVS